MQSFRAKAVGEYILLKVKVQNETQAGIIIPTDKNNPLGGKTQTERRKLVEDIEVVSCGNMENDGIKPGAKVFVQGFVMNQQVPMKNIGFTEKEHEKSVKEGVGYYWAKEEHIIAIIK